jgi:hypothetical protein
MKQRDLGKSLDPSTQYDFIYSQNFQLFFYTISLNNAGKVNESKKVFILSNSSDKTSKITFAKLVAEFLITLLMISIENIFFCGSMKENSFPCDSFCNNSLYFCRNDLMQLTLFLFEDM